jgi:hypothetical protein
MWLYDRPTSFWVHAATVALPVVVLAACLFPLAPWYVCFGICMHAGRPPLQWAGNRSIRRGRTCVAVQLLCIILRTQ